MSSTAGAEAVEFAAELIRFDTTNRGGGDAKERTRRGSTRIPVSALETGVRIMDRLLCG